MDVLTTHFQVALTEASLQVKQDGGDRRHGGPGGVKDTIRYMPPLAPGHEGGPRVADGLLLVYVNVVEFNAC